MEDKGRWIWTALLLLALILSLAACAGGSAPAEAAEVCLRARTMAEIEACVDPDSPTQTLLFMTTQLPNVWVTLAQGEYTELKVRTVERQGKRATVHATGEVEVDILGRIETIDVDVDVPMVHKQDRWYVTAP